MSSAASDVYKRQSYNVKKRERKKCILKQIKNCLFSIFIENTERKYTKIGYLVKNKKQTTNGLKFLITARNTLHNSHLN